MTTIQSADKPKFKVIKKKKEEEPMGENETIRSYCLRTSKYKSVDEAYNAGFWFDGMAGGWEWEGKGDMPPLCDFPSAYLMEEEDEEEEEDCVCGNNFHKGWVDGVMRCEDCDIDGKNYEGSDEEADVKKVVEIVGCDAECGQDSKYSDMYGNNYCSKKCEYREE